MQTTLHGVRCRFCDEATIAVEPSFPHACTRESGWREPSGCEWHRALFESHAVTRGLRKQPDRSTDPLLACGVLNATRWVPAFARMTVGADQGGNWCRPRSPGPVEGPKIDRKSLHAPVNPRPFLNVSTTGAKGDSLHRKFTVRMQSAIVADCTNVEKCCSASRPPHDELTRFRHFSGKERDPCIDSAPQAVSLGPRPRPATLPGSTAGEPRKKLQRICGLTDEKE